MPDPQSARSGGLANLESNWQFWITRHLVFSFPPEGAARWRIWCEPCRKWDTFSASLNLSYLTRQT
jgi:hypothetical protein